jgi:hypothetical protein
MSLWMVFGKKYLLFLYISLTGSKLCRLHKVLDENERLNLKRENYIKIIKSFANCILDDDVLDVQKMFHSMNRSLIPLAQETSMLVMKNANSKEQF